jgi:Domain of unknown function (DUF4386)
VKAEKHTPRLLGAAFLLVIVTSAIGGTVFNSAVGSGSISDILIRISQQPTLMRISILADLANGLAIVVLAVLLYMVLNKQNKTIALIALGWWLAEALFDPISRIGAAALIPLSQDFVNAGAPDHSYYQMFGEFLYAGVARQGYTIHMFFYCAGGILWYYLFYTSKYIRVKVCRARISVCHLVSGRWSSTARPFPEALLSRPVKDGSTCRSRLGYLGQGAGQMPASARLR